MVTSTVPPARDAAQIGALLDSPEIAGLSGQLPGEPSYGHWGKRGGVMNPKPICPTCGNTMFHCGLAGEPFWCGACNTRTHTPDLQCPKCERPLDKRIGVDAYIDPDLACPPPPKRLAGKR